MTGPEGNSEFCFPRMSIFPEAKLRETKFTVPQGTSHEVICYIAKQMGQTGGKQMITLMTNDMQKQSKFCG